MGEVSGWSMGMVGMVVITTACGPNVAPTVASPVSSSATHSAPVPPAPQASVGRTGDLSVGGEPWSRHRVDVRAWAMDAPQTAEFHPWGDARIVTLEVRRTDDERAFVLELVVPRAVRAGDVLVANASYRTARVAWSARGVGQGVRVLRLDRDPSGRETVLSVGFDLLLTTEGEPRALHVVGSADALPITPEPTTEPAR